MLCVSSKSADIYFANCKFCPFLLQGIHQIPPFRGTPALYHPSFRSSAYYLSAASYHPLPEAPPPVVTPSSPPRPPSGSQHYTAGASPSTSVAGPEATQTAATRLDVQGTDIR